MFIFVLTELCQMFLGGRCALRCCKVPCETVFADFSDR